MTRVPNIRDYEGFAEGVNWTEALSVRVMVDFINSPGNTTLGRQLVDWFLKDHSPFSGYNDERFDSINRKAYQTLLEKDIDSEDFSPLRDKRELVVEGLSGLTLGQLKEGKADNYSLDLEDTDENKKLIGQLVGERILYPDEERPYQPSYASKLVEEFKNLLGVERIEPLEAPLQTQQETEEFYDKYFRDVATLDGLITAVSDYINSMRTGFTSSVAGAMGEAYLPGGKDSKPIELVNFLADFQGGILVRKRYRDRGRADNPYYKPNDEDDDEPEELNLRSLDDESYIDYLIGLPKSKLVNQLNRSIKRVLNEKLSGLKGFDSSTMETVLRNVDSKINTSLVTEATSTAGSQYTPSQVGEYSKEIDDDVLANWLVDNESNLVADFFDWLMAGGGNEFKRKINWNTLTVSGVKGSMQKLRRVSNFKGKHVIADPNAERQNTNVVQNALNAISDKEKFDDMMGMKKVESYFAQDGLFDGIVDLFNRLDDLVKSSKSMYKVSDDERLFPDVSKLREKALKEKILEGDMEEFNDLYDIVRENIKRLEDTTKEDEIPPEQREEFVFVDSDVLEEANSYLKELGTAKRTYFSAITTVDVNSFKEELVRVLNEMGKSEEADFIRGQDLNEIDSKKFSDLFDVGESPSSSTFVSMISKEYFGGEPNFSQRETKVKAAKLFLFPILYEDFTIGVDKGQVKSAPATISYSGQLTITHDLEIKGLVGEYLFEGEHQVRPEIGTRATDFSVGRGATREGEKNITPSGEVLFGEFDTAFNKKKDDYKNEILKKLAKLDLAVGGN